MPEWVLQSGIKYLPVILERSEESGKEYGCYIRFIDYPMPDSSLRVRLCFFFHQHSDSARRSRMTARCFYFAMTS